MCVYIYFFSNYLDCAKMVCLQSNRRERCNVQNSLLWNMPLGPSHGQERMGRVHLPACAWVCFLEIIIFLHIIHMVLGWALFFFCFGEGCDFDWLDLMFYCLIIISGLSCQKKFHKTYQFSDARNNFCFPETV